MSESIWPAWLGQLAAAAASIDGSDLSRFLPPEDGTGRASAVLIAFADTASGPSVLLIERAADLRKHPGQVAFPGGSVDPGDSGPRAAALREATEEVGLDPAGLQIIADLPPIFIPVSGFVVTPVLAWWAQPQPLGPIDELVDPANRFRVPHPSGWIGPGFQAQGLFVWGFTAGLLDRLLTFAGWALPWDDTQRRELPQPPATPTVG